MEPIIRQKSHKNGKIGPFFVPLNFFVEKSCFFLRVFGENLIGKYTYHLSMYKRVLISIELTFYSPNLGAIQSTEKNAYCPAKIENSYFLDIFT